MSLRSGLAGPVLVGPVGPVPVGPVGPVPVGPVGPVPVGPLFYMSNCRVKNAALGRGERWTGATSARPKDQGSRIMDLVLARMSILEEIRT